MVRRLKRVDWSLFLTMLALVSYGLVMIYSSSALRAYQTFENLEFFFARQFVWGLLGIGVCLFVALVSRKTLIQVAPALFVISVLLLFLVLIPVIGREAGGARRWIDFGLFSFQPSELARVTLILMLAAFLSRTTSDQNLDVQAIAWGLFMVGLVVALVGLGPDVGMAVLIFTSGLAVLFVAGLPIRSLLILGFFGVPFGMGVIFISGYRRARLLSFLNPWGDPYDHGYHTIQALAALGNGGFAGKGLGESLTKISMLPEPYTDSIVAVIGEELGFLGVFLVVGLVSYLIVKGFIISLQSSSVFDRLLGIGVCCLLGFQSFINLAVISALIPVTGMTMPFISYGGSSLVTNMLCMGLLLNISRRSG